jgi:hypothetical protein
MVRGVDASRGEFCGIGGEEYCVTVAVAGLGVEGIVIGPVGITGEATGMERAVTEEFDSCGTRGDPELVAATGSVGVGAAGVEI